MSITKKHSQGFSLLEVMAVISIIAIVSAVTIPGIIQSRYRNDLIQQVNNVQEGASLARSLALQTRQAAVLEVRNDMVWVNLLASSLCDPGADLSKRCVRTFTGTNDEGEMPFTTGMSEISGLAMCGGGARVLKIDNGVSSCNDTPLSTTGFALCYSGMGELFVRIEKDANMECTSTVKTQSGDAWLRACGSSVSSAIVFEDNTYYDLYDGAMMIFNRFDDGTCTGDVEDVRRGLFFPSGGAPFNKVAKEPEVTP